jgi:cysteine desulfuration protein SufE
MTLAEKKERLGRELAGCRTPQDRFARVLAMGRDYARLSPGQKVEEHLVPGCLSRLWLVAEVRQGRCHFRTDSDSTVVRAMAGLLADFYSGQRPVEILQMDPSFLRELGLEQHVTANRRNALSRLWERIRQFALAAAMAPSKGTTPSAGIAGEARPA